MPSANVNTGTDRTHKYNAHATAISGELRLPVAQSIVPQTHTTLPEEGGYFAQRADQYRLEGIISIDASRTHTTGNLSPKKNEGWITLTTTVVEGLNVMEVVTADRVVGQMITDHPRDGYVPKVKFLGTRFENLRIAGNPIEVEYDFNVLGSKPPNDEHYVLDSGVAGRLSSALDSLKALETLPEEVRERYNQLSSTFGTPQEQFECSLVKGVKGSFPGFAFGPYIWVPDFGHFTLGKIVVKHENYVKKSPKNTTVTLTMIDFHLGCAADGSIPVGTGSNNGGTSP